MNRIILPSESGPLHVAVVRSARARRMALRLETVRGAVLVRPGYAALVDGERFVWQHHDWLLARQQQLVAPPQLEDGATVPLYGEPLRLTHCPEARRGVWCEEGRLCVSGRAEYLPRRTLDFLKAEAQRHIIPKAHRMAALVYPRPVRVSIKDTRSRWGSCAVGGRLSFCWRLVLTPEWVIDSVIAHEVAHLKEMNHGPAFWRLAEQLGGDPAPSRQWFKRHGTELLRFGATQDT